MKALDLTQTALIQYLEETRKLFEEMLSVNGYGDTVVIIPSSDLGFPHDVIRIAGGFATGAYVQWISREPVIPIDTCVNDCSVSFFELSEDISELFTEEHFTNFERRIEDTIFLLNFHRGNHFFSYIQDKDSLKKYLLLHSSANEFKSNYNGLYPVEGKYFYNHLKKYSNGKRYIRYLHGSDAELFWRISNQLGSFNEARQEYLASVFIDGFAKIINSKTYHHYGMPTANSVIMGGHVTAKNDTFPLLTNAGKNIYLIKYYDVKDDSLIIPNTKGLFITPHGLGKEDITDPVIELNLTKQTFTLDGYEYNIRFGESLRAHPNLRLRSFNQDKYFSYYHTLYDFSVEKEFVQLASWSKNGIKIWLENYL